MVLTFLPRSKHLLISWLQSPSAVILEPPEIKSATVSTVSPSGGLQSMGSQRVRHDLATTREQLKDQSILKERFYAHFEIKINKTME